MSAHSDSPPQRIPVVDLNNAAELQRFHERLLGLGQDVVHSSEWLQQANYAEAQGFPLAAEAFRSTAKITKQNEDQNRLYSCLGAVEKESTGCAYCGGNGCTYCDNKEGMT